MKEPTDSKDERENTYRRKSSAFPHGNQRPNPTLIENEVVVAAVAVAVAAGAVAVADEGDESREGGF